MRRRHGCLAHRKAAMVKHLRAIRTHQNSVFRRPSPPENHAAKFDPTRLPKNVISCLPLIEIYCQGGPIEKIARCQRARFRTFSALRKTGKSADLMPYCSLVKTSFGEGPPDGLSKTCCAVRTDISGRAHRFCHGGRAGVPGLPVQARLLPGAAPARCRPAVEISGAVGR